MIKKMDLYKSDFSSLPLSILTVQNSRRSILVLPNKYVERSFLCSSLYKMIFVNFKNYCTLRKIFQIARKVKVSSLGP